MPHPIQPHLCKTTLVGQKLSGLGSGNISWDESETIGVKEGRELGGAVDEDASWGKGAWREEGLEEKQHVVH